MQKEKPHSMEWILRSAIDWLSGLTNRKIQKRSLRLIKLIEPYDKAMSDHIKRSVPSTEKAKDRGKPSMSRST